MACANCFLIYSVHTLAMSLNRYRTAGNFRGRKLSRISRFFSHPRKFSPRNSRHATPIIRSVFAFRESFLREMLFSYRSAKVFSLENFPLYGISCIVQPLLKSELDHVQKEVVWVSCDQTHHQHTPYNFLPTLILVCVKCTIVIDS